MGAKKKPDCVSGFFFIFVSELVDVNDFLNSLRAVVVRLALVAERNCSRLESEQRVVGSDLHIASRHDNGSALADDDGSSLCLLSGIELGSEVFRI